MDVGSSLAGVIVEAGCRVVQPKRIAQLGLSFGGVMLHLCPPQGDTVADTTSLIGDPLRRPTVCHLGDAAHQQDAGGRPESDVEHPPHSAPVPGVPDPRRATLPAARSALTSA